MAFGPSVPVSRARRPSGRARRWRAGSRRSPVDPLRPLGGTVAASDDRSRSAVPAWSRPVIVSTGGRRREAGSARPPAGPPRTRIGSATRRRAANTRASADGRSRWWASSRRMASGWRSARRVITPRVAAPPRTGPAAARCRGPERSAAPRPAGAGSSSRSAVAAPIASASAPNGRSRSASAPATRTTYISSARLAT